MRKVVGAVLGNYIGLIIALCMSIQSDVCTYMYHSIVPSEKAIDETSLTSLLVRRYSGGELVLGVVL